ncbi:hypothetical protein J6590_029054 [Homalodisca vitripennis]|nr:hypothetical protein J6590_029054 [Homalodisca vitripennis]
MSKVKHLLAAIVRWSLPLYLPLIAAEAILLAGLDEIYAYCHLVMPLTYLLLKELLKKHVKTEFLDCTVIVSAISLCYSTFIAEDMFGVFCALINMVAYFGARHNSMEYLVLIGIAHIIAVEFFKHLQGLQGWFHFFK